MKNYYSNDLLLKRLNGDWHTRLLSALGSAKSTSSPELLALILPLEKYLKANDECIHNAVVKLQIPDNIDIHEVINSLSTTVMTCSFGEKLFIGQCNERLLLVAATDRGSRETVEKCVESAVRAFKDYIIP